MMTTLNELDAALKKTASYGELLETIEKLISLGVSINAIRDNLYQVYEAQDKYNEDILADLILDLEQGKHGKNLKPSSTPRGVVEHLSLYLSLPTKQGLNNASLLATCIKGDTANELVMRWLSDKNTLAYLRAWELANNPTLNVDKFDDYLNAAGSDSYVLPIKAFVRETGVLGIIEPSNNLSDIWLHNDLAIDFCLWVSPKFKHWFINERRSFKKKS